MATTSTSQPSGAPKAKSRTTMYAAVGAVVVIVVVVIALFLGGYLGGGAAGTPVEIRDDGTCAANAPACNFTPASVNITAGGKVTWTNKGTTAHTVTNDPAFSSTLTYNHSVSSNNAKAEVTFPNAGTYHYYCEIHQWMKGTVNVS